MAVSDWALYIAGEIVVMLAVGLGFAWLGFNPYLGMFAGGCAYGLGATAREARRGL